MRKAAIFLIITLPIWAGTITKEFTFSSSDLIFTQLNQYTLVEMKGADVLVNEGEPITPYFIHHIVIPPSAEVKDVEVIEDDVEYLPGKHLLYPGQKPRPLSSTEEMDFINPNSDVYSSALYPEKHFEFYPTGSKHGWRICVIDLYPLSYLPKDRKLKLAKTLKVIIHYEEGIHSIQTISERQFDVFHRAVKALVSNPGDVDQYRPNVRPNSINDKNYAIISSSSLLSSFSTIKDWKTKKGYLADTFSTTWIYANYPNNNGNQGAIRYFLRDYYENKGLIFAILAGDIQHVPDRDIYDSWQGTYIASDWYYCDLDSNWNRNGNSYYGEIGDVIPPQCYFEVYCARPPVDDAGDVTNFANKLMEFEKTPNLSGIRHIVLPSEQLWAGWHGRVVNNAIFAMFPSGWTSTKLEDQSSSATVQAINNNDPQFCHIAAHGNTSGTSLLSNGNISSLNNQLPFICNSIACYSGNFDGGECFAEMLIIGATSPKGCVATIFNSRYGWGNSSGPMGPSEELDTTFYSAIAHKETLWVGVAHAVSKEHNRNRVWGIGVWHYCGTELNLFGDPEMCTYLDVPVDLHASHPSQIPQGAQNFTVTVTDSKAPVEDALVCCYKDGEVHETGRTDASGQVTLSINPQTNGQMYVTATAFNYLPYEGGISVGIAEEPGNITEAGIWIQPTVTTGRIKVHYGLKAEKDLKIELYNSIGAKIAQVYQGRINGTGSIDWDAKRLPAGVYFVKIESDRTDISRILLIR